MCVCVCFSGYFIFFLSSLGKLLLSISEIDMKTVSSFVQKLSWATVLYVVVVLSMSDLCDLFIIYRDFDMFDALILIEMNNV